MLIWLDNFAIPAGAEHKENAYKFISYLMRPEVAKAVRGRVQLLHAEQGRRKDP